MNEPALQALDSFISRINSEACIEAYYGTGTELWGGFNCPSLQEYLEL